LKLGPVRLLEPTPSSTTLTVEGAVIAITKEQDGLRLEVFVEVRTTPGGVTVAGRAEVLLTNTSRTV
jgi:hypothetical protein